MTTIITTVTVDQNEVLVILDAIPDMTDVGLSTFLLECGLQDLHDNCDIVLPPETYYKGKRKINFCLGTSGIANAVTQAGITSCEGGFKYSDHRALFVDMTEELLFTSKGVDPIACKGRGLVLKNKQAVQK